MINRTNHQLNFVHLTIIFVLLSMSFQAIAQDTDKDFKPNGKIFGYIFGDVLYKAGGDTLTFGRSEFAKEEKHAIGGKLRRVYFGYDYNLAEQWSVRFLLEGNSGITTSKNDFTTKIKLGYLQYKMNNSSIFHNAKINVGLIPTPTFALPQQKWGYRSVEKEALDLRGFGSSVDQGVSIEGDFSEKGIFGYYVMVSNGVGSKPEVNKNLQYHLSIFTNLFEDKLTLETFANYVKDKDNLNRLVTRQFISYNVDNFRFGFEGSRNFLEEFGEQNNISKMKELQPLLLSGFASTRLMKNIWALIRYDYLDPDMKYKSDFTYFDPSKNYNEHLFIAGLEIEIHNENNHKISIYPNIYVNAYDKKKQDVVSRDADVVLRTTLYYNF